MGYSKLTFDAYIRDPEAWNMTKKDTTTLWIEWMSFEMKSMIITNK